MKNKKKKTFTTKLNFDKADFNVALDLHAVGVCINDPNVVQEDGYFEGFKSTKDWLSFGMLGNTPQFHAGTNAQNLVPKPEDFVEKPFRLISATTVGAGTWKATDFSRVDVLRASLMSLEGKPLYKDHETDLDNWVGLVKSVKWSESFMSNGVRVPAGIDGIVAVDAVTNPKVARGLLMGSIFSNSVTVQFEWEMSHSFENEWDFYDRVGTMGKDGQMVRRIVTNINDYHESSLVWLGADPFAKAINTEGDLQHIDTTSIYEYAKSSRKVDSAKYDATEKELMSGEKKYVINFGIDKNVISLARKHAKKGKKPEPKKVINMNKKFLAAFIAKFGKQLNLTAGTDITPEQMIEHLGKLSFADATAAAALSKKAELADKVTEVALAVAKEKDATVATIDLEAFLGTHQFIGTEDLTALNAKVTTVDALTTKVTNLTASAKVGEDFLKLKRDEAIRLYKASVGTEKVDEAVVALFSKAEDKAIDGLLKQYSKSASMKFAGKCNACQSADITFQSSFSSKEDETTVEVEEEMSFDQMYDEVKGSTSTIPVGESDVK